MQQGLPPDTNSSSPSQNIPRHLWNLKLHYRVHMNQSRVPILSQINPVHTIPSYFNRIHVNIIVSSIPSVTERLFHGIIVLIVLSISVSNVRKYF
jgi:hypothetical protein